MSPSHHRHGGHHHRGGRAPSEFGETGLTLRDRAYAFSRFCMMCGCLSLLSLLAGKAVEFLLECPYPRGFFWASGVLAAISISSVLYAGLLEYRLRSLRILNRLLVGSLCSVGSVWWLIHVYRSIF